MVARQRWLFAFGGVLALAAAIAFLLGGFALSVVWPGVSWALGGALALLSIFFATRWLWAALTGRATNRSDDSYPGRGTL